MMAWCLQISLMSLDVRAPNGTRAKVNGHEAGVCGRFEKEHGKTLAQMVMTSLVSVETNHDHMHTREMEECV